MDIRITTLVCCLSVIFRTGWGQLQIGVTSSPSSPTEGDTVEITCAFTYVVTPGPPARSLSWVKLQRDLQPLDGGFTNLYLHDVASDTPTDFGDYTSGAISGSYITDKSYTLRLTDVSVSDSGRYTCSAQDTNGYTVRRPPSIILDIVQGPSTLSTTTTTEATVYTTRTPSGESSPDIETEEPPGEEEDCPVLPLYIIIGFLAGVLLIENCVLIYLYLRRKKQPKAEEKRETDVMLM